MSRQNDRPQQYWKEPPKETSYEAHVRRKRLKQKQRARSSQSQVPSQDQINTVTRPPADAVTQEEVIQVERPSGPLRQRGRMPEDRPPESYETEPPSTLPRQRTRLPEDYPEDAYETEVPSEPPRRRSRPSGEMSIITPVVRDRRVATKTTRHLPEARRRRVWPWLLAGCAGGVLTIALILAIILVIFFRTTLGNALFGGIFNQTFPQKNQQQFPISNFAEIKVDNNLGNATANVTIVVDQSATVTTVKTVKTVKAANMNDANKEFALIPVIVNPGPKGTPALTLTICGQSSTACGNTGDTVDITISLPPSTNADGSYFIDVQTRSGNVSLQLAQTTQLAVGSCLSTGSGNVTFTGTLATPTSGKDLIPCTQEMTTNPHPWYTFHSEVGTVDVTQMPVTKNVLLDASVTSGKINSDGFNLSVEMINRSLAYHGPLIPDAPQLSAELKLDVGTGDINLHRI